ncbi:UNVERIFIED_CONTAM: hypothetical protein PYX00_004432 [Menopon gallinae]|uniref:TGF-beta family profile domain-containing protein n=1 Tax=Menopon gallinae TaxID=328185 RepID=A0AAW2I5K3_9NEOP
MPDFFPPQLQSNISQTEFETKHREYFDLVEQNQRRRLNSTLNYDEENIVRKKLFRFTHSGLEISRNSERGLENLNYNVYIPEESNSYTEIEETSLRLLIVPKICAGEKQRITLKVVKKDESAPIREETFEADECLPKWVGLDLSDGAGLGLRSNFRVSVECDECGEKNVELGKPYLNVIVNVKSRSRRRRAENKGKRNRRNRNCDKIPLEVNFAKIPGYHYIVQPKSINVGLCTGRCPVRWRMSQHAILQHLVSKSNSTVPKPCCSPSKMEGLEYLYLNEEDSSKLKVGFWNDTIVVECRCS